MAGNAALIVAAGRGRRFGGDIPKQYLKLNSQSVLHHTLRSFHGHPEVEAIQVVIHPDDRADYDAAAEGLALLPPVHGGETRQASVLNGLKGLASVAPDNVLVHDGARPNACADLISRVIAALHSESAVIPTIPIADTLKSISPDGKITGTVDRSRMARAQTPQGFRFAPLLEAHQSAGAIDLTDDAAVMEAAGYAVTTVMGHEENLKITTPEDLQRMSQLMTAGLISKTGQGFDVHAFETGDHVTLCGIDIPHTHKLAGHSDADVALHAVTDAILGAAALGDIGDHFPPSDPQWKGAPSDLFLKHAVSEATKIGGRLAHIDLTLICEAPKIGPHRAAMQENLANLCGLALSAVSVKATTTERLGFTGRKEGIACLATATLFAPL